MASVEHLSDEKKLDLRVLHGDGTNTVAKKGAMGSGALVPFAADQSVFCSQATFCIKNISWREKLSSNTPKATAGT